MKLIRKDNKIVNLETVDCIKRAIEENAYYIQFFYGNTMVSFNYESKSERDAKFKRICHIMAIESL